MILMSEKAVAEASLSRPDGYIEEVYAAAHRVADGVIHMKLDDYERLLEKYSGRKIVSEQETDQSGVGFELKKILSRFGIHTTDDCPCEKKARYMNKMGIEWCEANIDEIVGWLREEATKRGLPFVDMAGRMLVKRAIHNARKATLE